MPSRSESLSARVNVPMPAFNDKHLKGAPQSITKTLPSRSSRIADTRKKQRAVTEPSTVRNLPSVHTSATTAIQQKNTRKRPRQLDTGSNLREQPHEPSLFRASKRTRRVGKDTGYDQTQSHPVSPNRRKRTRAELDQNKSSIELPPKRRRLEPAKGAKEDRVQSTEQRLPTSHETDKPKVASHLTASYTPDIEEWVEQVTESEPVHPATGDVLWHRYTNMQRVIATKKSLSKKRSSSSLASDSDRGYQDGKYTTQLEACGGIMKSYRDKLPDDVERYNDQLSQTLLEKEQPMPETSLFSDDCFEDTMDMIQDRNEAFIIRTIGDLMFPKVQERAIRETKYKPFVQSFDEVWNNCIKVTQTVPKPDSAIGFGAPNFSDEQHGKLRIIGDVDDKSYFRATYYMYFPCLMLEVKGGTVGLDIADRQNGHSATVAVFGIVNLFRKLEREKELHGKYLVFSVFHDHRMARLYGYKAIIDGEKTYCYRDDMDAFDIKARKGKNKWKSLQFCLNALDAGLELLEQIRSAIDEWKPNFQLESLEQIETTPKHSELSQIFVEQALSDTEASDSSNHTNLQQITPESSEKPSDSKKRR
ncbi:hypothetical protein ACMFMF_001959 [Clarireedia jacksonii]